MHIDIVTIFPKMFEPVLGESMLKRAQENGVLSVKLHDLRNWTHDKHRSVDDRPYGGGPGMVMKPEPIFEALETLKQGCHPHLRCVSILMTPRGEKLSPSVGKQLASSEHLIIICGHYEGVDERVMAVVDRSVSIGDYVLTGGELPAMVMIDVLARFVPGVIGHEQATAEESFSGDLLEYPQYTRPQDFRGMGVPEVLVSGDHEAVARWRKEQAIKMTATQRPDLFKGYNLPAPRNVGKASARQAGGKQRG